MKKMHILAAAAVVALGSGFAVAQTAAPKAPQKLDTNGDGVISKAEAAAAPRLAARFDQLDTNKDGRLSAEERPQRRGGMHRGHGRMHNADADKDGRISKAEAQAAADRFASRFDAMDVNKDGFLDKTDRELRMRQQRAEFFSRADSNKDGALSRDEFIVERGARAEQRQEKFKQRAGAEGGQRKAPTDAQRIERAGATFDRIDSNKDGRVSKAEFDAFQPMRGHGKHAGPRQPKG